jgi:hypothetical protein
MIEEPGQVAGLLASEVAFRMEALVVTRLPLKAGRTMQ